MPNHITNILTLSGEDVEKVKETIKGVNDENISFNSFIPEPETHENITNALTLPFPNWYHWRVKNWGTKWDAYRLSKWYGDTISFETAWSTPFAAFLKLSQLFPKTKIEVKFASEDVGSNLGSYILQGGNLIAEMNYEYSEESIKVANSIFEEADSYYYNEV